MAAPPMRPGLWEITNKIEGKGMPAMPANTARVCITQKDLEGTKVGVPGDRGMENCAVTDTKMEGNKGSWKFACKGATPVSGSGTVSYQGDGFTQTMTMSMPGNMTMLNISTGKRMGDCSK